MASFGMGVTPNTLPPPISLSHSAIPQKSDFRSHYYSRVLPGQVARTPPASEDDPERGGNHMADRTHNATYPAPMGSSVNVTAHEMTPLLRHGSRTATGHVVGTDDGLPSEKQGALPGYLTLTTAFIGGGLLALPYGTSKVGLALSGSSIMLFAAISAYTLHLLVRMRRKLAHKHNIVSISELGELAYGATGSKIASVSAFLTQVGFCCAYAIFVADNLHSLIPRFSMHLWIVFITPVFILLSWLRSLRVLAPTSTVAVVCVMLVIGVVLEYGFHTKGIQALHKYKMAEPESFPLFWGIAAFGFCVHNLILPFDAAAGRPELTGTLINASVVTVMILYLAFGLFGYMFFGSATKSVITLNLPHTIIVMLVKIALCVVLTCTFPIQLFPVTTALEGMLLGSHVDRPLYWLKQNVLRASEVIVIAGIAIAIPLFGLFSSLMGAFSVSAVVFILPTLFYLKLFGSSISTWDKALNGSILVIGTIGSIVATVFDVVAIISALRSGSNSG